MRARGQLISEEQFLSCAFWAADLSDEAFERARRGIVEKSYPAGAYLWHRGDRLTARDIF